MDAKQKDVDPLVVAPVVADDLVDRHDVEHLGSSDFIVE